MTIQEIFNLVSEKVQTNVFERTRKREIVEWRYMAFYLSYIYADGYVSESTIASFCDYDRTTILRAFKEFPVYLKQNETLQKLYTELVDIVSKKEKKYTDFEIDTDYNQLKRNYINLHHKHKKVVRNNYKLRNKLTAKQLSYERLLNEK